MFKVFAAGAVACLLACSQASAAVVLDQADVPQSGPMNANSAEGLILSEGMTFTVGVAGTLAEVDVGVFNFYGTPSGDMGFLLLNNSNQVLFSTSIPATQTAYLNLKNDWSQLLKVDTASAGIAVTPGEKLSWVVLPGTASSDVSLLGYINGASFSYSRGGGVYDYVYSGANYLYPQSTNFPFRTYVDVASVPEPSTWMLAMLGVGLLGLALRRGRGLQAHAFA